MKKVFSFFLLQFFFILILGCIASAEPEIQNKLILKKDNNSYVEARHIIIKGTNEEIGKALGDIAKKDYNISRLIKYPDKTYADAIDIYMKNNYPALRDRAKGIARSYNVNYNDLFMLNSLIYDAGPWNGCSSVYYPPAFTTTGAGILAHNMDYPLVSLNKLLKMPSKNEPNMFTRNFIMELYPDKGYASIGVGTGDLLTVVSGMNEKGLIAILHTDNYTLINTNPKPDFSGLIFPTQMLRYVLENCETVEEAKIAILNNKISLTFEPAHLLIADKSGKTVAVEINPRNIRIEFTGNNGKPQPFTNHPLYRFKDPASFPKYTPFQQDNTFARFNLLRKLIGGKKQVNTDDIIYNQVQVAARWNNLGRGQANPIPNRTIWTDLYDQKNLTVKVRFFLKDGPVDPKTNDPKNLVFSDFFDFKIKR